MGMLVSVAQLELGTMFHKPTVYVIYLIYSFLSFTFLFSTLRPVCKVSSWGSVSNSG